MLFYLNQEFDFPSLGFKPVAEKQEEIYDVHLERREVSKVSTIISGGRIGGLCLTWDEGWHFVFTGSAHSINLSFPKTTWRAYILYLVLALQVQTLAEVVVSVAEDA